MPIRTSILGLFLLLAALSSAATSQARPNVVLVQTDDQTLQQLYTRDANGRSIMSQVLSRIGRPGVRFDRYYATYPICCPSRTSLLTGQYVHNHRVLINRPPFGYTAFRASASFHSNLATWLQEAGYRTIHVGKFMNFYGDADPLEIPPGWSDWRTIVSEEGARRYYGYTLNVNGSLVGPLGDWNAQVVDPTDCAIGNPLTPNACAYSTDVDTGLAVDAIEDASGFAQPFFLQVDYTAPHLDLLEPNGPAVASRDGGSAAGVRYRPPGFDEKDIEDKPRFIQLFHRLSPARRADIDARYQRELESLRAVDRGVGLILDALEATGQMRETFVFFTSDNGQFHGEHRIAQGKYLPYEPAAHMPLLVRGPGIPAGARSQALVANIDIAPTIAAIAGAGASVDGRSVLPFANNPNLESRRPILLEGYAIPGTGAFSRHNTAPVLDYFGVVAGRYKYVRYAYGEQELYDLMDDPAELRSLAARAEFATVLRWGRRLTTRLKSCEGLQCQLSVRPPQVPDPISQQVDRR